MSRNATSQPLSVAATSQAAAATALAPGFRFHPTDEELVIYYLKRKVFGKPFRVDAITEVDLYKSEPWDLPDQSRIRSRDMEWYFFSPLDKKYANRSKTSRTTGKGYWKTTGKDRAVRHGSRVVGMKKTLVFHTGKAPRGERTNWVMHEYRLENDELVEAGSSQEEYVVCRIFRKTGAGPQNGAQYGAPFREEEWEKDDHFLFPKEESAEGPTLDLGDQPLMQLTDFDHESKTIDIQEENASPLLGSNDKAKFCMDNDRQNIIQQTEGSSSVLTYGFNNQDFNNFINHKVGMPEFLGDCNDVILSDNGFAEIHPNYDAPLDDYLELNDFGNIMDTDLHGSLGSIVCHGAIQNDQGTTSNTLSDQHLDEFLTYVAENANSFEPAEGQIYLAFDTDSTKQNERFCPVIVDYSSYDQGDDTLDENPIIEHGSSLEMNESQHLDIVKTSESDLVDELLAYFNATDNISDSSLNEYQFAPEVNRDDGQTSETSQKYSNTKIVEVVGGRSCSKKDHNHVVPDAHSSNGSDMGFKNYLFGMLGSISAPPALAAEHPMKGFESVKLNPASFQSMSIHVSSGVIRRDGLIFSGNGNHWSVQKDNSTGFLSYDVMRDEILASKPAGKMLSGTISLLICTGFCLWFFSVLFLAVSFKIGLCICSK